MPIDESGGCSGNSTSELKHTPQKKKRNKDLGRIKSRFMQNENAGFIREDQQDIEEKKKITIKEEYKNRL